LTDLTQGPLPQPISITFSAAACGAGKTFWATRFAASRVGLGNFVFALDRIDEFAARRQMLLDAFAEIGRPPCRIEAIHAQNPSGVTQAIRDFPKECREPTILFITHAGLQLSDLSAYRDWYLIVDEVPNCWFSDELKTPATWQWFADTYNLTHVSASWSQVTAKATAPTVPASRKTAWETRSPSWRGGSGTHDPVSSPRSRTGPTRRWMDRGPLVGSGSLSGVPNACGRSNGCGCWATALKGL